MVDASPQPRSIRRCAKMRHEHGTGRALVFVVVPVYNGGATLADLVRRIAQAFTAVTASWEVILVNDASRDDSWGLIEKLAAENPVVVRGYRPCAQLRPTCRASGRHSQRERGRHRHDGRRSPAFAGKRIPGASCGPGFSGEADVVYGLPAIDRHDLFRRIAAWAAKALLERALGVKGVSMASSFRVFRTSLRSAFAAYEGPDVNIDALLSWGTARFAVVPIEHRPREHGRSTYTLRELLRYTRGLLTGFSVLPLRLASYVGFVLTVFGFLVLADVIGVYFLQGGGVPGFPFLASIVAIFSGAQLFALGIIGEYLACIHFRAMHRPTHVVRKETP